MSSSESGVASVLKRAEAAEQARRDKQKKNTDHDEGTSADSASEDEGGEDWEGRQRVAKLLGETPQNMQGTKLLEADFVRLSAEVVALKQEKYDHDAQRSHLEAELADAQRALLASQKENVAVTKQLRDATSKIMTFDPEAGNGKRSLMQRFQSFKILKGEKDDAGTSGETLAHVAELESQLEESLDLIEFLQNEQDEQQLHARTKPACEEGTQTEAGDLQDEDSFNIDETQQSAKLAMLTAAGDTTQLAAMVLERTRDMTELSKQVEEAQQETISYKRRHVELCSSFQELREAKAKAVEDIDYERTRVTKMEAELLMQAEALKIAAERSQKRQAKLDEVQKELDVISKERASSVEECDRMRQDRLEADRLATEYRIETDDELLEKDRLVSELREDLATAKKEIVALTDAVAKEVEKRIAGVVHEEETRNTPPRTRLRDQIWAGVTGSPSPSKPSGSPITPATPQEEGVGLSSRLTEMWQARQDRLAAEDKEKLDMERGGTNDGVTDVGDTSTPKEAPKDEISSLLELHTKRFENKIKFLEKQVEQYKDELVRKRDEVRAYIMRIPDVAEEEVEEKTLYDRALAVYQRKIPKEYEELLHKLETLLTDTTLECSNLRDQNASLREMLVIKSRSNEDTMESGVCYAETKQEGVGNVENKDEDTHQKLEPA